jgi:predicted MFS family arabinose efflux permease
MLRITGDPEVSFALSGSAKRHDRDNARDQGFISGAVWMPTTDSSQHEVDVNGWSAILSAVVLGTIGVLSFIIQPGIVQGFVTELGVSEGEAVNLAGLEMLGVALATIALAAWGGRIGWRTIVALGLALAIAGDLGSALSTASPLFPWFRFLTGLGEGTIISISFTFVGITVHAERNVALYLVMLLTYGAFGLWYLPEFLAMFGLPVLFYAFAALSVLALLTIRFVPHAYSSEEMANPEARQLSRLFLLSALAGVLAYNLAQGIAWAILFLVGTGAGIDQQHVADALFLSQILAIGGALSSVFLADKLNRNAAIATGIMAGAASIALLLGKPTFILFTVGVCGFNVLWNFVLPFILGRICDFDESGRMMSYAIAMQMAGLGAGPLIAAQLLDGSGYRTVELVCITMFVASYVLLLIPIRRHGALLDGPATAT